MMMMQVNGVDLSKVDKVHLTRMAAQLGAKAPPGATAQRLVEEVGKIFERAHSMLAGPCDNCGGMSDSALSACPFCGVGEGDDEVVHIAEPVEPQQALAIVGSSQAAAVGERNLDEAMGRIESLKASATVNLWKLGREIKAIYDGQLWLQRTKDGKPAYKAFEAFVHGELKGLSKTTAYWLMDISEAFDEKQVLAYGRTKLGMVLKAPKEDRALLLDKVKGGIKTKALSAEVDAAREARGNFVRETSRGTDTSGRSTAGAKAGIGKKVAKAKTAAAKKTAAKTKKDSITIAKMLGKQQVNLWCRPDKRGAKPTKRARKITDKPYGLIDLENGVQMQFGIMTSSAGDWILVVSTERPEAE